MFCFLSFHPRITMVASYRSCSSVTPPSCQTLDYIHYITVTIHFRTIFTLGSVYSYALSHNISKLAITTVAYLAGVI